MRVALATACLAIAALAVIALIQGETAEEDAVQLAPPPETADPLPELPPGWSTTANAAGGFAVGVPPGWSVKSAGEETTMKAPDSSVVVRVTADRTETAVNARLDDYVESLLAKLGGTGDPNARTVTSQAGYEQASATAIGSDGKRLEVVVVRRLELAAFPILVASDDAVKPAELDPLVTELVGSLRGRPATSG
jgi:hypothetical protein